MNQSQLTYGCLWKTKCPLWLWDPQAQEKQPRLNAIACLVRPDFKMISVEEVQEINLPQENWVSTIARTGFGGDSDGEVTLYDLIKSAVRHRPALILVGEIRGEEAYVLFQALATGHGGLCTMHADDVETVIKRLTQPPMNIPQNILSLMNCVIVVKQVNTSSLNLHRTEKIHDENSLRSLKSTAAEYHRKYSPGTYHLIPSNQDLEKSYLFNKIAQNLDAPLSVVQQEFERRKQILLSMVEQNLRDFRSVHKALNSSLNLETLAAAK